MAKNRFSCFKPEHKKMRQNVNLFLSYLKSVKLWKNLTPINYAIYKIEKNHQTKIINNLIQFAILFK